MGGGRAPEDAQEPRPTVEGRQVELLRLVVEDTLPQLALGEREEGGRAGPGHLTVPAQEHLRRLARLALELPSRLDDRVRHLERVEVGHVGLHLDQGRGRPGGAAVQELGDPARAVVGVEVRRDRSGEVLRNDVVVGRDDAILDGCEDRRHPLTRCQAVPPV